MKSQTHYIYILTDPTDKTVYYVGKTVYIPNRKSVHLNGHNLGEVGRKTAGLLAQGVKPVFKVVDQIETYHLELALRYEACWRARFTMRGNKLTNGWHTGILNRDPERPLEEMGIIKQFAFCDDLNEYHEFMKQRAQAEMEFDF